MNNFKYSNTNKRYHTLDYYFKQKFGYKVGRIPINAGFTCPNIDGTTGFGGCSFCNTNGSGDFAGLRSDSLITQWHKGKEMMRAKWADAKFIAYFQAFSNTYSSVDILREKYELFTELEDCVGISIGTRADCLDDDIIDYLADLNKRTYLIVELGLQTSNDDTARIINRGHDAQIFTDRVEKLRKHKIEVVVHIINGLPTEDEAMMLSTVAYVNRLDVQGIKIHLLHVMSDTPLVNQLNNGFLQLMTREDYVAIVVKQLEMLRPEIVVHRLTGDAPSELFIGPIWSKKKTIVLNEIDKRMVALDTYQGVNCET